MPSFCPQPAKSSRGLSHHGQISFVELTHRQQIHKLLRRHRRATLKTEASQQMSSFKPSLSAKSPINRRIPPKLNQKPNRYQTENQEGCLSRVSLYGLLKQMNLHADKWSKLKIEKLKRQRIPSTEFTDEQISSASQFPTQLTGNKIHRKQVVNQKTPPATKPPSENLF